MNMLCAALRNILAKFEVSPISSSHISFGVGSESYISFFLNKTSATYKLLVNCYEFAEAGSASVIEWSSWVRILLAEDTACQLPLIAVFDGLKNLFEIAITAIFRTNFDKCCASALIVRLPVILCEAAD